MLPAVFPSSVARQKQLQGKKKKNLGKIKSEAIPTEQPGSHSQATVKGDEEKPSALHMQKYHKKKNQELGEELLNTRAAHLISYYKASP